MHRIIAISLKISTHRIFTDLGLRSYIPDLISGYMRWGRREEEPSEDYSWQRVNWETTPGFARKLRDPDPDGIKGWEFSAELPEDTNPQSVILGYSADTGSEREGLYTVSYSLKGSLRWSLLEVRSYTKEENNLIKFGAHIQGNFQEAPELFQSSQTLQL